MDKNFILGFVVGAGLGALVTYFTVKNRIQERADEDVESMREYVKKRLQDANAGSVAGSSDEADSNTTRGFRRVTGGSTTSQEAQNEMKEEILKNRYNYASKSGEYSDEEGGETVMPKKSMIYAIESEEFDNGNEEYDKASLTWYPKQHILTDEDDKRISTECIGGDKMLEDGFEDGCKYVRNDALSSDYEIVVDDVNEWEDSQN